MIPLTQLLSHEIEEVLRTPLLRQAVVSYTRNLFYGGAPVSACDSSCRNYYRRLKLEGVEIEKKLSNMKYQLKPGIFIVHNGQSYNASTMTDSIAEDYLAKFPKAAGNFIIKDEPAEAAPAAEAKPKAPRKKK